ncbi:cytochrome c oxidase assembly factor 1 homolog isoform X2 [Phycodurus eques]|uniref:cytochrome c oxidase assembly factor 1 homolog isoform X2 n=1 Tax=Phycodurus eques TaxID=693459 RepID=UPI002ACEC4B7|nr:cytochrome c oxidase assembly factor 1 homolog isoform X2 [Phycodurus eques]
MPSCHVVWCGVVLPTCSRLFAGPRVEVAASCYASSKMRVSTAKLQQLTIFTTLLTGGGIGTMYYLMQKKFAESDYHQVALQKLEACAVAMESLGAPPLKIHNIHLTDRHNRIDQQTAQIKIPVTGSRTGGYLYTSSIREPDTNRQNPTTQNPSQAPHQSQSCLTPCRWSVKLAVLRLKDGQTINLMNPPSIATEYTECSVQGTD